jgi:hypothetical protein
MQVECQSVCALFVRQYLPVFARDLMPAPGFSVGEVSRKLEGVAKRCGKTAERRFQVSRFQVLRVSKLAGLADSRQHEALKLETRNLKL